MSSIRKYTLDENYFESIDSEHKAYILGFIAADGNNYTKKGHLTIKLQYDDLEILEKIKKSLNFSGPITFIKRQKSHWKDISSLRIVSKKMSLDLINVGIVSRKSLILEFPSYNIVPYSLIHHYVRGYFDGDGHFSSSVDKKGKLQYRLTIASGIKFINSLKLLISSIIGSTPYTYIPKKGSGKTSLLNIGGRRQIQKIMDWMYKDATIFLERKHQTYIKNHKDFIPKLSKFVGVSYARNKSYKRWYASCSMNGVYKFLGYFQSEEEAYKARIDYVQKLRQQS